jgi:hypothetical protein
MKAGWRWKAWRGRGTGSSRTSLACAGRGISVVGVAEGTTRTTSWVLGQEKKTSKGVDRSVESSVIEVENGGCFVLG